MTEKNPSRNVPGDRQCSIAADSDARNPRGPSCPVSSLTVMLTVTVTAFKFAGGAVAVQSRYHGARAA